MNLTETDLWRAAVHEAGHAVIGRALNMPYGRATIIPDRQVPSIRLDDLMVTWRHGDKLRRPLIHSYIVASMAGREAEIVLLGEAADKIDDDLDSAHRRSMVQLVPGCRFVGDAAFCRYERKLRRRARQLCQRHRIQINCVAKVLIERRTLSRKEIDQVLAGSKDVSEPARRRPTSS